MFVWQAEGNKIPVSRTFTISIPADLQIKSLKICWHLHHTRHSPWKQHGIATNDKNFVQCKNYARCSPYEDIIFPKIVTFRVLRSHNPSSALIKMKSGTEEQTSGHFNTLLLWDVKPNNSSASAEMGDRLATLATTDMGQKVGAAMPYYVGEAGSHLIQCLLERGLPLYQVVSWSIQQFGHNRSRGLLCPFPYSKQNIAKVYTTFFPKQAHVDCGT